MARLSISGSHTTSLPVRQDRHQRAGFVRLHREELCPAARIITWTSNTSQRKSTSHARVCDFPFRTALTPERCQAIQPCFSKMATPTAPKPGHTVKTWLSLSYWRLETTQASFATRDGWSNEDVDVVAPEKRTWREVDYLWLWLADGANVGTMQQAGSILALGLGWREASAAMSVCAPRHFLSNAQC